MREYKLCHSYRWLKKKYMEEKLSCRKIADLCNVNPKTIYYYLRKYGINTKTRTKVTVEMETSRFYLPCYLMDSWRGFSRIKQQSMSFMIKNVMTEYMLQNKYNPFTNREFREQ